jgi:hypothetical protein
LNWAIVDCSSESVTRYSTSPLNTERHVPTICSLQHPATTPKSPGLDATVCGYCQRIVNRTFEIHAWLLAALLVGVLGMTALLLFMVHVHAGDLSYIAHTHRPIIVVPTGAPPVVST